MTDTTAPDAITQVDCEAADALENELGFLTVEEMPKVRAAFARHRRLAAHGAGEGLREALERIADPWNTHWSGDAAREALDGTPPTDAGSTTREGGEGVLTERGACARIADELADDPHDIGAKIAARIRNRTEQDSFLALAATSSPDASPDSGEAERLADELDKLSSSHRPLLTAAANELRRLAASPASLSGGAEESPVYDRRYGWENDGIVIRESDMAAAREITAKGRIGYGEAIRRGEAFVERVEAVALGHALARLRPSPEAPANRQEAGEVAIWSGEHRAYWRRGSRGEGANYTLNLDEAGIWTRDEAAKLTSHCGPEKLIALHDRPTLTSPKDVKGGGR